MATTLYDATISTFVQIVGAAQGFMARSAEHCAQQGIDVNTLVEARLIADMLPLSFQVRSMVMHSVNAIEDAKKGSFTMPGEAPKTDFAGLQKMLAEAATKLAGYQRAEIEALDGRPFTFKAGEFNAAFTADNYLLSFSVPNFLFHTSTAYGILRMQGMPIGKRDFLGALRVNA